MSHNIEKINGEYSFFEATDNGRLSAWHRLGKQVDNAVDSDTALHLANADFEVKKVPLICPFTKEPLTDSFGIYRTDTLAKLGTVGERYTPIQNTVQFELMDKILGDNAKYETAGVLGKGERVFALAQLSEFDVHNSGDKTVVYLLGFLSHDGSSRFTMMTTNIRVVCRNTLNMAVNGRGVKAFVKHTKNGVKNMRRKLNELKPFIQTSKTTHEIMEFLATKKFNNKVGQAVLDEIFKVKPSVRLDNAVPTRTQNNIDNVFELFEDNDGDTFKQFRGTAYNLLNATTEYYDFEATTRSSTEDKDVARAESALFGTNAASKSQALNIILEHAKDAPTISHSKAYSTPSGLLDSVLDKAS